MEDISALPQGVGLVVTARTVAEVLGEWKGISVDALLDAEQLALVAETIRRTGNTSAIFAFGQFGRVDGMHLPALIEICGVQLHEFV